jgi:hypothetical protein
LYRGKEREMAMKNTMKPYEQEVLRYLRYLKAHPNAPQLSELGVLVVSSEMFSPEILYRWVARETHGDLRQVAGWLTEYAKRALT